MDEEYLDYKFAEKSYLAEIELYGKVSDDTHNRLCDAHTQAINNFTLDKQK